MKARKELEGMLFDLPAVAMAAADCPESWIRNIEIVDLWAKGQQYVTHDVAWFKMPDGSLVLSLPDRKMVIPPQDDLGRTRTASGETVPMQTALDMAYRWLCNASDARQLWDNNAIKRWGRAPASEKQINLVRRMCKDDTLDYDSLTKGQASMHFCNRLLRKEPKEAGQAPAMIVFCAFDQDAMLIDYGKQYGFNHSYPIFFIKDYSAQVLKANMTASALSLWTNLRKRKRRDRSHAVP